MTIHLYENGVFRRTLYYSVEEAPGRRRRTDAPLDPDRVAYRLAVAASHWTQVFTCSDEIIMRDGVAEFSMTTRDGNFRVTVEEIKGDA